MDMPNNCAECEHYDGMCNLAPWESWRTLEVRRPEWCPLERNGDNKALSYQSKRLFNFLRLINKFKF